MPHSPPRRPRSPRPPVRSAAPDPLRRQASRREPDSDTDSSSYTRRKHRRRDSYDYYDRRDARPRRHGYYSTDTYDSDDSRQYARRRSYDYDSDPSPPSRRRHSPDRSRRVDRYRSRRDSSRDSGRRARASRDDDTVTRDHGYRGWRRDERRESGSRRERRDPDKRTYERRDAYRRRSPRRDDERDAHLPQRRKERAWLDDARPNETLWQRRRRMREMAECPPIWQSSPSPPRRLEDRFEVGADDRKRKERRRKRKEERRAKREAKRARRETAVPAKEPNPAKEVAVEGKGLAMQDNKEPVRDVVDSDEEGEMLGPAPPPTKEKGKMDYGKALRPGEGSMMARFVQDGARIPRRGEIGLTSEQIEGFESQGYVMSGSRNRRMEAVRIRKENQVYSAEELAALKDFSHEERKLRETRVLNQFRMLVESKLGNGRSAAEPQSNAVEELDP